MNHHAQFALVALFVLGGCGDQPSTQKQTIEASGPAAEDSSDRREESTEEESEGFEQVAEPGAFDGAERCSGSRCVDESAMTPVGVPASLLAIHFTL
jgi:hypothetical protein